MTSFVFATFSSVVKRYGDAVVREIGERLAFENSIKVQQYVADSTANLIRNVNETTKKRIRRQMGIAFDNQETVAQIRDRIESVFVEASGYRAQSIAVTESTRLTGFSSDEAISQSGVQFKEWLSTLDGSTRDAHSRMDGQIVSRGSKFVAPSGQTTDHPGGFGIARLDINCFVPDTKISANAVAGSKSFYSGKTLTIKTLVGKRLTVTPNHPILTPTGFIAAHLLRKGDNVLSYSGNLKAAIESEDIQHSEPTIEQAYTALSETSFCFRVDSGLVNFYGDSKLFYGDVDVIFSAGSLTVGLETQTPKLCYDSRLVDSYFAGSLGGSFDGLSLRNLAPPAFYPSSTALPSNSFFVLLDGLPFNALRFGTPPNCNASIYQVAGKSLATATQLSSQLIDANPESVFVDSIVEIIENDFCGHVYDLQTVEGVIIADGIITSNCRCAVVAAFPEKSARTEIERRSAWDAREKRRKVHEKEVLETFEKIFTMQKEAVMQKVTDIAGE